MNASSRISGPLITIALIFFGLFLYTTLVGPIPFNVNSIQTVKQDVFRVSGVGESTAVPDSALILLGVTEQGTTVTEVQKDVNVKTNNIISSIKKLGIEEKNIKTTNYSVHPNYSFSSGDNKVDGYSVTQNLEVRIKPIDLVNKTIDQATTLGANLVGGIQFVLDDKVEKKLEEEARKDAVKNAKEKAQSLARVSGLRLGRIIDVQESGFEPPIFYREAALQKGGAISDVEPSAQITPGQNTVRVTITLSYETL